MCLSHLQLKPVASQALDELRSEHSVQAKVRRLCILFVVGNQAVDVQEVTSALAALSGCIAKHSPEHTAYVSSVLSMGSGHAAAVTSLVEQGVCVYVCARV